MPTNPLLISVSEYARRRKCSRRAIEQALKAGRITRHESGKIDPIQADLALDTAAVSYSEALSRRTLAQAQRQELALALEQNQLVRIAACRQWMEKANSIIRQKLLSMPTKLGPILSQKSTSEIKFLLEREIHETLQELANHGRK
jgi:phage terminase Nu1 subunit (DNA packaging protein)